MTQITTTRAIVSLSGLIMAGAAFVMPVSALAYYPYDNNGYNNVYNQVCDGRYDPNCITKVTNYLNYSNPYTYQGNYSNQYNSYPYGGYHQYSAPVPQYNYSNNYYSYSNSYYNYGNPYNSYGYQQQQNMPYSYQYQYQYHYGY